MIAKNDLDAFRSEKFYRLQGQPITTPEEAVTFIEKRGFILFWPDKASLCPSLWSAVAGDRPVADEHDDPGHVTWGWKDNLLGKKLVFYSRVIRHRNTFISLELLPAFYALSPNFGSPEDDYLIDYEAGRLTAEARAVYEALLTNGPLDTIALRKTAHLSSKNSDYPFNKALDTLQYTFRILPVGVAEVGAWNYAFIYDLVPRHFTWLVEKAHPLSEWDARRTILFTYINMVGAARPTEIARLFNWSVEHVERSARKFIESGVLIKTDVQNIPGEHIALAGTFNQY